MRVIEESVGMNQNYNDVNKRISTIYITSVLLVLVMIAAAGICCLSIDMDALLPNLIRDISVDYVALAASGILIVSIARDKPWDQQNRTLFRLIFTLCLLLYLDIITSILQGHEMAPKAVLWGMTLQYFCETLLIYCFWKYIVIELNLSGRKVDYLAGICKAILLIDMISALLNMRLGYFFTVLDNAQIASGPAEKAAEITSMLIYFIIWGMIVYAKDIPVREKAVLSTFQVFPVLSVILRITTDIDLVYPAYLLAAMLIYNNVFSERGKRVLEQQAILEKQSMALMISQIQPHFLYNVLTTISNLCVTDPEEAEETTVLFSQYLRTNLDSLRKTEPVPFQMELGHINTYIELEKKRFKDKINVVIDCPDKGFTVPSLGLQPIVENSIKHGIRGKDSPGHLSISSHKVKAGHLVIIEDDGVGFDMAAPVKDDGRSHVGMKNVKNRLEKMCGAVMTVESSPGNGCKTTILFPFSEEKTE